MAARSLGVETRLAHTLEVRRHCRNCGGPHGKPSIDGVTLSLSRSGDQVMVASSTLTQPLGADLEAVTGPVFAGFDSYALSEPERDLLRTDPQNSDRLKAAATRTRLWVAKEAALKATGHGLSVDPKTLHIARGLPVSTRPSADGNLPTKPWAAVVRCPETPDVDGLNIAWLPSPAGYAVALAAPEATMVVRRSTADLFA